MLKLHVYAIDTLLLQSLVYKSWYSKRHLDTKNRSYTTLDSKGFQRVSKFHVSTHNSMIENKIAVHAFYNAI